jgi:hypothetical protein
MALSQREDGVLGALGRLKKSDEGMPCSVTHVELDPRLGSGQARQIVLISNHNLARTTCSRQVLSQRGDA